MERKLLFPLHLNYCSDSYSCCKKAICVTPRTGTSVTLKLLQSGDVFAEDVEFKVDDGAYTDVAEVGVLEGVGDDGDLEGVAGGVADGEADAVDGDGAFVDGEITLPGHLAVFGVFEGEVGGAVGIVHRDTLGRFIDMTLNDMTVESSIHQHGAFYIDFIADLQQTEVRAVEGLLHGGDGVGWLRADV